MPEIDQSYSTSNNTIFHKNKNITKINNYEYRIINLNDLKNKNNNHKFGNSIDDSIDDINKNNKHIPYINDKERMNHINNILAKKKDKKLNQVLKPGGEGMQYLINTLKKYQMIQQKQQQRKKQKQKFFNMQPESDEEMNDSYQHPFNKFNGFNIGNYNNQHPNYKNYMYDNKMNNNNNVKLDMKKESNNYNDKLPIINSNNNAQKKYGIVNQTQMIFKRNNDPEKKQPFANQNHQISNNQEKV
ncbi:hypothetical protein PIROE2DRAFT_57591 [Piromyces sp. E2]|nr:hypothetical protein PIROE2DRAFT_57591 [Piromyces sp. E2]|eukprot:OUM69232.1 hypothetical protein PIROE2DRAFT_57591 [Piromyces sp. E2]